jgi:asparagine synthase (glutamine-hydrolysing)
MRSRRRALTGEESDLGSKVDLFDANALSVSRVDLQPNRDRAMCGIAGILSSRPVDASIVQRMTSPISHRGPDDHGVWLDDRAVVGLGHRRLSIVDLSPLGHQPMLSSEGRFVLSFNGEIYNHLEIRKELEQAGNRSWRGHSDTETLVEAIAAWGLERTLKNSVGMFALALWDKQERKLSLARDRFGEKPLYYGWCSNDFVFGSELKALRGHPGFSNGINRDALRLLAARGYIPAPLSIYQGIFKLQPGCILTLSEEAARKPSQKAFRPEQDNALTVLKRYWSYRDAVAQGLRNQIADEREAQDRLEEVLTAAIKGQSVADVPVGSFLSGGIDSSTVVALYQKHSSNSIRTFSIGFEEAGFNEAVYAAEVAKHLGTQHNEMYVSASETRDVIPSLPWMYDEPFGDSSQIPTHLVSKFARGQVTVALSGDGGDELFGGYNRYFLAAKLWETMNRFPGPLRKSLGSAMGRVPPGAWNAAVRALPGARRPAHFGMKVQKAFRTMSHASALEDIYNSFLDEWTVAGTPVLGSTTVPAGCDFDFDVGEASPDTVRMMYCDAVSYLPDDILCKVDRASMAVSLESRVPFLDHRVAELAAKIPLSMKIKDNQGKNILRKVLYSHAPEHLFDRPKAGFGIPVGEWIRGPLRPWAEELLDPSRLKSEGYLDAAKLQQRWSEHKKGGIDHTQSLWPILMFQAWHEALPRSGEHAPHLPEMPPSPAVAAS